MKRATLLSMALAILAAGCVSRPPRCLVAAANATDAAVPSVVVHGASGTSYTFTALAPHAVAAYVPAAADLGATVAVAVASCDGAVVTNTVRFDRPVRANLDARVLFQVEAGARVRAFVMPADDERREGVLPWAVPPSWQGVPTVPGFSAPE